MALMQGVRGFPCSLIAEGMHSAEEGTLMLLCGDVFLFLWAHRSQRRVGRDVQCSLAGTWRLSVHAYAFFSGCAAKVPKDCVESQMEKACRVIIVRDTPSSLLLSTPIKTYGLCDE